MLQLNCTFDIIIHPRRVTVCESFYLISYEISENVSLNKGFIKKLHLGVDIFTIKGVFLIKRLGFDIQGCGINISIFIVPN